MAKVNPSIINYTGTIGRVVHYTRFGRTYSRQLPAEYNDRKSEAQLRQRALFKARQHAASLFGTVLQRGLTKEAHDRGLTEANYFSRLNKDNFVYSNGQVHINYPALLLARGPLPAVGTGDIHTDGLHVDLTFHPNLHDKARPDDIVHIYAVSPDADVCMLMASVERHSARAAFDLPDVSDEVATGQPLTFHLYAIVEATGTALIPTLSADEKKANRQHRNINRRVSPSLFLATVTV